MDVSLVQTDRELVDLWLGKKGNVNHICKLLKGTGSYIAGNGLYQVLTSNDMSGVIEIYANREAAKLFLLSSLPLKNCNDRLMTYETDRILLKNGVFGTVEGNDVMIHITNDPYRTIQNMIVNHSQVYFDGEVIHKEILSSPLQLNKFYLEDYLSFNTFINSEIRYFLKRGKAVAIDITPEYIGKKLAYTGFIAEYHLSAITVLMTEVIFRQLFRAMTAREASFFGIDRLVSTSADDDGFSQLKDNLERMKKQFLPEVYGGIVNTYLATVLYQTYMDDPTNTPDVITNYEAYSVRHFGVRLAELNRIPYQPDSLIYGNKLKIRRLLQISEAKTRYDELVRWGDDTRSLKNLEFFTKPSAQDIQAFNYDETKYDKCMDMESLSFYDINAFLNGEAVMAYSEEDLDGKREEVEDYAIEPVPPEVARKRLVFFVASDERATIVKPYCYNLDLLEKDLATRIYSDTCTADGSYRNINKGFSNPLFRLAFETAIHVRLSELLKALYQTKSQAFLLIPTRKVAPRTASLSTYLHQLGVSGDHCQEGTDKRVYRIVVCGKGSDKCYPLRGDIQFRPDSSVRSREQDTDYSDYIFRFQEDMLIGRLEQDNIVHADELVGNED